MVKSLGNYGSTVELDRLWKKHFVSGAGSQIVKQYIKDADKQLDLTAKYFTQISGKLPSELHKSIRTALFETLGYNAKAKKLRPDGTLSLILSDRAPINSVKGVIHQAVASGLSLDDLQKGLRTKIINSGLLQGFFAERIPDPYDQFDRMASKQFAEKLNLSYVIYQGGTIKTSRPFCIERNGKVFTTDEIEKFGTAKDKFGGYANKSKGEFQGKTKIYVPFRDLGGYNCRHHLDYITEELALTLRPDLKT